MSARRWSGLLIGLAALFAVVAVALHLGDVRRFGELLRQARPAWLALAVALQVGTYACEAGVWRAVLARGGVRIPFSRLYGLSLAALFTGQALPTAGVSGSVLVVSALVHEGVPRGAALAAVFVDLLGYYASFAAAVAFTMVAYGVRHDLPPIIVGMCVAFVALAAGISGGVLWLASSATPRTSHWPPLRKILDAVAGSDPALVRTPALLLRAAALRTANVVFDGLTLWACLAAVGGGLGPGPVCAAYVLGAMARTLGVVPGGLGTFEGAAVGGLALLGVPVEPALTAVLLYRGLSFWLPMAPGLWAGRRFTG